MLFNMLCVYVCSIGSLKQISTKVDNKVILILILSLTLSIPGAYMQRGRGRIFFYCSWLSSTLFYSLTTLESCLQQHLQNEPFLYLRTE